MKSILVAGKNFTAFRVIRKSFQSTFEVEEVSSKNDCLSKFRTKRYEFLFVDLDILLEDGGAENIKAALQSFWHIYPTVNIIVMASSEMTRQAVVAVKAGANDYLTYPLDPSEVRYITESINESLMVQSELDYFRDQFWQAEAFDIIQTRSSLMRGVFEKVRSVSPTRSTVLLTGETGTGKGVLAKIIHQHSNRKEDQFINVHCGAIPDTLLESELFGHEKGAFTGAVRRKLGKFEIASGGTIFLDEIGTLTPMAQIKLLQVLQDGTFQRVGGETTIETDVRIISATNSDLKALTENEKFRKDLYYRLNVFPIEVPSLFQRKEDIPLLVDAFLKRLNHFNLKDIHDIHPQVMEALMQYSWPGNIRELENLIERAYILETSHILSIESFPNEMFENESLIPAPSLNESMTLEAYRNESMENAVRFYLKQVLSLKNGKIKDTAEIAGISTRQLHKLMKKYGLRKEDFKTRPN
jgi:DNA-binding NtrC family response regulator